MNGVIKVVLRNLPLLIRVPEPNGSDLKIGQAIAALKALQADHEALPERLKALW